MDGEVKSTLGSIDTDEGKKMEVERNSTWKLKKVVTKEGKQEGN